MPRGTDRSDEALRQGRLWTPAMLRADGRLLAWYDASDLGTITTSSGLVSQWNDKSGRGFHLTQGTAGARPTPSADGFAGGLPGLTFDGGDGLTNTSFSVTAGTKIQAFAVCRPTSTDNYDRVVALANAAGADSDATAYIPITRIGALTQFGGFGGSNLSLVAGHANDVSAVMASTVDATNHTFYINGTAGTPVAYSFTASALTRIAVGQALPTIAADAWNGLVSEVVLVTGLMSTAERLRVEGALAWKWRLVDKQAASSPYKNSPPLIGS